MSGNENNDHAYRKRTLRLKLTSAPLVVDIWSRSNQHTETQTPILLIHGWGGSGSYWEKTAEALSHFGPVYVPDLPGCGRSMPIEASRGMFQQVAALGGLIEYFDLKNMHVVAHSMGSAMALLLYDAYPERISKMVLTSMCFFLDEGQKRFYKNIMQVSHLVMRFRPRFLADVPGMVNMMGGRYFHQLPEDKAPLKRGLVDYLTLDYGTAVKCADDAVSDAIPEAGRKVTIPTMLIVCRQDRAMPIENVDYTVSQIPGCDLRWIEECGHLPMVEKTEEFLDIVKHFLAYKPYAEVTGIS